MDRTNIFASHDDHAITGWFDYDATRAEWTDLDYNGNGSLGAGRGTGLLLTAGGKWVSSRISRWQGESTTFAYVTAQDAREWLIANGEDAAVAEHFGELPEEEDRRPGRPEIGGRITTALGDEQLAEIDDYAARAGLSRAAALRRLAGIGLRAVGPLPGMRPVVIDCNVVTGHLEVDTSDWGDSDARWRFVEDIDFYGAKALSADVEPWGDEEFGMERATEAARELGYTVSEWEEGATETWRAVVTGRA